jgi:chemotaxis protein MotB
MGRKHKQAEEEEGGESAPLWMISFADMMSLLMAFFVMLSTFSDFGPAEEEKLRETVDTMLEPVMIGGMNADRPMMEIGPQATAAGQLEKGSETRTLDRMQGKALMAESQIPSYKARKVFVADSSKVFWGNGVVLSADGQLLVDTLAAFIKRFPGRIVISENGPGGDFELGLHRAINVVECLAATGTPRSRCNIGARGMLPKENEESTGGRLLEIVVLDESVYK